MTTELCGDNVVVHLSGPQIISSETIVSCGGGGAAGAGGGRASAAAELGRRLLVAARAGDTPAVLDLMAKGAPFTTDWLGTSPLHLAAGGAHAHTCAVLLRAGVSRDARTKVERTPLHLAACAGHAHVAQLLLEHGAQVDCRDMLRMTPLHWAVERGHAAAARVLLRHGADPAAACKFHRSPLSLAAARARPDLLRLLEAAARQREADRSVHALVSEQMSEPAAEPRPAAAAAAAPTVHKLHEYTPADLNKPPPPPPPPPPPTPTLLHSGNDKPSPKRTPEGGERLEADEEAAEEGGEEERWGAGLLRRHGIALLPTTDDSPTVLNALHSGRTVVLSDAGKLMLKESTELSKRGAGGAAAGAGAGAGVVLTATPVRSPPKPGVKIFTINNKLVLPREPGRGPVKRIIHPHDLQVQLLQLPPDSKLVSAAKSLPMKAKAKLVSRLNPSAPAPPAAGSTAPPPPGPSASASPAAAAPAPAPAALRPAVKIIMNKSNFNKLMASASSAAGLLQLRAPGPAAPEGPAEGDAGDILDVSEEYLLRASARGLRAYALAAHRALGALRADLRHCRARLRRHEGGE